MLVVYGFGVNTKLYRRLLFCAAAGCTATVLFGAPVAQAAAAGRIVDAPISIDATGKRDVGQELNQLFERAPANATVRLVRNARYRVETTLTLRARRGLIVDGNHAMIFAATDGTNAAIPNTPGQKLHWPRLRQHLAIWDSDNVTIRDLAIAGPNAAHEYLSRFEGQAGVLIARSRHVTIDGVHISGTYGDGMYLSGGSDAITVRNSEFRSIGRQGIALAWATNVDVGSALFDAVARSAIDVEPFGGSTVAHIHVHDSAFRSYKNFLLAANGAPSALVEDLWIEHNDLSGSRGLTVNAGLIRHQRRGIHLVANHSVDVATIPRGIAQTEPIQITNYDGIEIRDNVQPIASGAAVAFDGDCHATISGNDFRGAKLVARTKRPCGALDIGRALQPSDPPGPPGSRRSKVPKIAAKPGQTPGNPAAARCARDAGSNPWLLPAALVGGGASLASLVVLLSWRRRDRKETQNTEALGGGGDDDLNGDPSMDPGEYDDAP